MVFSLATTTETNGNANLLWHSVWYGHDTIWSTSIVPFTITYVTPHSPVSHSYNPPPSLLLSHSLSNLTHFTLISTRITPYITLITPLLYL
jgi:hypothetical protein